ncbi:class I SAM-dependent methyltransferase [Skermanella sp. TT6]|uniref:Class I SAM-dependent methyltransferase n=1 Tax=Skermanella cutis TaxID=2775420 RepID=A0ABX7BA34_9PROT|nr:class I SAM-dependent methyltransferase [Skermanella sp. TT6]QQP91226.1 class I SAM-dependent methyltransferase [Skermanella sp. TT6]
MSSVGYYDENADRFFRDTVTADMTALQHRFAKLLPVGGRVLDAGCGSGRDAKAFAAMCFDVVAFDASAEMVRRAQIHTGLEVLQMTFAEVFWQGEFDGIWASASLLHVPRTQMVEICRRLRDALVPSGVLYFSFKHGTSERFVDGRTFIDMDESFVPDLVAQVTDLSMIELWMTADVRPRRDAEAWVSCLAQRNA